MCLWNLTGNRAGAVFLFLLALYILTTGQTILSANGWAMFATAENLVRRGSIDMDQLLWMGLQQGTPGRDGHLYSRKPPALSLLSIPLVWLGLELPGLSPVRTVLLFNAFVISISCGLLYTLCRKLGYGDFEALAVSLAAGMATPLWPYAKTFFSEPLASLGLLGAVLSLFCLRDSRRFTHSLLAGVSLGVVLLSKYSFAFFFPLFAWLKLRFESETSPARRLVSWAIFLAPQALALIFLAIWNWLRYEDFFDTGYLPQESFSAVWWQGILGLTLSPGKGLVWYAPLLLLLPLVVLQFHRRHREISFLIATLSVGSILLFGKWFMWHSGDCWGPRFLIPLLPLLMLPLAEAFRNLRLRPIAFVLSFGGIVIQLPGIFVPFGLYRELTEAKGIPLYAPETFFNPILSPLILSWSFLKPENFNFIWKTGGEVDFLSLALLLLVWGLTWWLFLRNTTVKGQAAILLAILLAACLVIARAGNKDVPEPLREMLSWLARQEKEGQAIINPQPLWSPHVSGAYRGRLPVYGLEDGHIDPPPETANWLGKLMDWYEGLWLLPAPSPPEMSGIERVLMAFGYRVREENFSGLRLALYLFPKAGMHEVETNLTFDGVLLEGYAFSPFPPAEGFLLVELRWRALSRPAHDYLVILSLVDDKNQKWLSKAGVPALWTRPTSSWQPGERIIDRHGFVIPEGLPSACYTLTLQLYEPIEGRNLPLMEGDEILSLGEVCLKPLQ
ncbi:MAG: hypothetical protein NZ653_08025 [Anaerolineae bacterium]|nr:hypothetical protein [Anaerolineae bacterium]